jgi:hypothetical protein
MRTSHEFLATHLRQRGKFPNTLLGQRGRFNLLR